MKFKLHTFFMTCLVIAGFVDVWVIITIRDQIALLICLLIAAVIMTAFIDNVTSV